MSNFYAPNNCPIREFTVDDISVGRCWFHCVDDICPRHGDVSIALKLYRESGKLTNQKLKR